MGSTFRPSAVLAKWPCEPISRTHEAYAASGNVNVSVRCKGWPCENSYIGIPIYIVSCRKRIYSVRFSADLKCY